MAPTVTTKVDRLTFLPTTVTPRHVPEGAEEGDTVREEREGHVRDRMSPPGSILQAYLPSALVHSVEEWMFSEVTNMYLFAKVATS